MSSLRRSLVSGLPPTLSNSLGYGGTRRRAGGDFSAISWRRYFDSCVDVRVPGSGDSFHVYRTGGGGGVPLLIFLHGGGFSGLSWALVARELTETVECHVAAIDLRGHGETVTSDEDDLSIGRMVHDVLAVIGELYAGHGENDRDSNSPLPSCVVLIGHSMGGALATHVAHNWQCRCCPLAALVVIDVVEGTAVEALGSMQAYLRSRPRQFASLAQAIEWSVRSGLVRNINSARVSIPGHLKCERTGEPATRHLPDEENSISSHEHPPLAPTTAASVQTSRSMTSISETSDTDGASVECLSEQASQVGPPPTGSYTWRVALERSECHWRGWFVSLSSLFVTAPAAKLLLLAGVDRLDRQLTIAQMQGKFQMQVLPKSGHAVHEDDPSHVAAALVAFLLRHKIATRLDDQRPH